MKTEVDIQIENLHKKAKALLKSNLETDEIITELRKEGVDSNYAELIIENVKSDKRNKTDAWKLTIMGIFFIFGGFYINHFSYQIAINTNSSSFYFFWGIIIFGIIILVRAFNLFRR